ncbi:MAG: AI-2E family transporter [Thermoleophilia bacterium]
MPNLNQDTPSRMRTSEIVRRAAIATATVLLVVGSALLLIQIRTILLWILVGIILAIALHPAVRWLMAHRVPRVAAALGVSLAAIAVLIAIVLAIVLPVILQAGDFIRDIPTLVRTLFGAGGRLHFLEQNFSVLERLSTLTPEDVANALMGSQEAIVGALSRAASFVAATITIFVIMIMLLLQGGRAWQALLASMVGEEGVWAKRIGDDFLRAVGGYVRGNLALSAIAGITAYLVLRILDIPYAETLAVTVAILDVIPLVGATIAMVIVSIVGFAVGGTTDGIVLLVFFIVYQQFENNVLQNLVYAKTVSLPPLVVFIAALAGAVLGGIVGALLAIPLASAGWTLGRDLIALRQARHAAAAQSDERSTSTLETQDAGETGGAAEADSDDSGGNQG